MRNFKLKREKWVPLTHSDQPRNAYKVQEIVTICQVVFPQCSYTFHQSVGFRRMFDFQWCKRGKYREWAEEVTEEFMLLFCSRSGYGRTRVWRHCPPSSYACLRGPNAPSTADRLALHVLLAHCSPARSLLESLVCLGGKRATERGWSGSLGRSPGKSTAKGDYNKATRRL
jgi:hypothetical protein